MEYYTFEGWMKKVDEELGALCGMSSASIADWDYRGAYQVHDSPRETARDALRNAMEEV